MVFYYWQGLCHEGCSPHPLCHRNYVFIYQNSYLPESSGIAELVEMKKEKLRIVSFEANILVSRQTTASLHVLCEVILSFILQLIIYFINLYKEVVKWRC